MTKKKVTIDRRRFLQSTAITAGALAIAPFQTACTATGKKEEVMRSNFGGVEIGAITYSFRTMPTDAGSILLYSLATGLGTLEMMGDVAENYAGKPIAPQFGPQIRPAQGQQLTPEQEREREAQVEARRKYNEEVVAWRLSVPMTKFEQLGKIYRMAGVGIHVIKIQPNINMSDAELDYIFNVCKAIGAVGVSCELDLKVAERVAPFAAKHGKYIIFHNHDQFAEEGFSLEPFFEYENARLNFDMAIYFGSTGRDPREIVEKYHDRIVCIHIKDYTGPKSNPPRTNRIWGQGETPLKEFLLYIQSNAGKPGWPVHCDIELSYEIPKGSDAVTEVSRCVKFVKDILIK